MSAALLMEFAATGRAETPRELFCASATMASKAPCKLVWMWTNALKSEAYVEVDSASTPLVLSTANAHQAMS